MPPADADPITCLFVYGTLRRDSGSDMAAWLTEHAQWAGYAEIGGALFMLDGYPGLVIDPDGQPVRGDLYILPQGDDSAKLLAFLDAYEECSAYFPRPHEYQRVVASIDFAGSTARAWAYVYRWPTLERTRIASGDFLNPLP